MKKYLQFTFVLLFLFVSNQVLSFKLESVPVHAVKQKDEIKSLKDLILSCYQEMNLKDKGLSFDLFYDGIKGFLNLKGKGMVKKDVVTLIDFSKPSTEERLWIIDIGKKQLLEHSLVAHGKNSGETYAVNFSNTPNSLMSSLGFYVTNETYKGKHGLSLRMEGMDKSNSNARSRAIVLHGAKYVSKDFIKCNGRLGRSWGCPAVPSEKTNEIIDKIKGGSVLLIQQKAKSLNSEHLDEYKAKEYLNLLP